jgi:DNA-binding NtrC family response regulator
MGSTSPDTTMTRGSAIRREHRRGLSAALFVVVHADAPTLGGARVVLRGVDRVTLGRGPARGTRPVNEDSRRIDLPDRLVSVEHAALDRALGGWTVCDLGSKNGLYVNGQRVARQFLEDGDWIEVGHTFLRFRQAIDAVCDADTSAMPGGDLRTLVPSVQLELERLKRVADKGVPVLLRGETGSGKELVARELHKLSGREGPFVAVNCGAIPSNLVEATLFGHRRGAFSGAVEDRPGMVASADRGTLLLDEIGDLPLAQQPALLRVLQEKEVVPVGDTRPRKVDVRFVAATHRDVDTLVRGDRFRADLLARLAGLRITVPPLREHVEDLGSVIASVLGRIGAERTSFSRDAVWAMCRYEWPQNVRELEQAVATAHALCSGKIDLEHLPDALRAAPRTLDRDGARRDELIALVREHQGNLAAVARALKTSRAQVHRLLARHDIDPTAYR